MCGIVGALSFENSPFSVTETYITRMRDTMLHRGPDGAATWVGLNGRVGLGHVRLSIIDPSEAAAQPMCNEDGTLWISFNGEIYNHAAIREELERLGGHLWKTDHSDTEVILHAFEQWGIDCLYKFRGMFAIALWNAKSQELWLIRDRIGIKPLYYSIHHGRLTFASEIKALLEDPDQKRAVHEEALYHYLSFLTTPAPQTLFDGIKKLAAGTWLRVNAGGDVHEYRYWDVWDHTTSLCGVSEEEIAERILTELRTAVKLRKVSDVPIGIFLSGGIDSSTNAALFSEGEGGPVKTFTIGFKGKYQNYKNELHYARKMADFVGAKYHERLVDIDDILDFLPQMVRFLDEPIADPDCGAVYYVSKLARENDVTVCQLGEGSDELFLGYPRWKQCLTLQYLSSNHFPWTWPKQLAVSMLRLHPKLHKTNQLEWLRRASLNQPIFWGGAEAFSELEKKKLLHSHLLKRFWNFSSYEVIQPIRERFEQKAWERSHLNWMSYLDLNMRLPELLLMRVDKMSMGASLEARVPFLDHQFVALAMSIPEAVKTKNGVLKYILKKAVRGLIPDELIDRQKQGFTVPNEGWFLTKLLEHARGELIDFCAKTEFLDCSKVMQLIEERRGRQVWYLLVFARWWREYIANENSSGVPWRRLANQ
jgi:asparagine synthase (glutamine-hydrolysing)